MKISKMAVLLNLWFGLFLLGIQIGLIIHCIVLEPITPTTLFVIMSLSILLFPVVYCIFAIKRIYELLRYDDLINEVIILESEIIYNCPKLK